VPKVIIRFVFTHHNTTLDESRYFMSRLKS